MKAKANLRRTFAGVILKIYKPEVFYFEIDKDRGLGKALSKVIGISEQETGQKIKEILVWINKFPQDDFGTEVEKFVSKLTTRIPHNAKVFKHSTAA